ncbi:MAG: hypothetical protein AB7S98_19370 [Burkholderiaceae bacterium]
MIGFGFATSHAPGMFCPADVWPSVYASIPDYTKASQPHTAKLETRELIESYIARIDAAFARIGRELEAYRPDAIIAVGDDHDDVFGSANTPTFALFSGPSIWGASASPYLKEPPEKSRVEIGIQSELADALAQGLVKRGFDISVCREFVAQGRRHPEMGFSHSVILPYTRIVPKLDVPIVPLILNANYPPLPSARRCWDLGRALADICGKRPERIAVMGSGGMSHDPFGPRAGWVDEPLDAWVFDRIEANESEELTQLFTFDSATLRGGTGELRTWIVAAGACRWAGRKLDYIPAHHVKTALGFCLWPDMGRTGEG